MTELATIDQLEQALAKAENIEEVATIRVQMETLAKSLAPRYVVPRFKAAKGLVKACRKHGEFWNKLENKTIRERHLKQNRGNKSYDGMIDFTAAGFKHRMDVKRCAAIAEMDDQDLELYYDECRGNGKWPTLGGAYEVWKMINLNDDHPAPEWLDSDFIIGDFREVDLPANSIDLIFTDPPYEESALDLYDALSERAADWLVPGGWCLAYAGQWMLPKVIAALSKKLSYFWTGAIFHTGNKSYMRKHHLRVGWKPLLMFYKPKLNVIWGSIEDVVSGGREKAHHPWQQAVAEAEHFVRHFCPEGGIILDPMCGSGTTLVAAKRLGLRHIGIEIDEEVGKKALKRLNDKEEI